MDRHVIMPFRSMIPSYLSLRYIVFTSARYCVSCDQDLPAIMIPAGIYSRILTAPEYRKLVNAVFAILQRLTK